MAEFDAKLPRQNLRLFCEPSIADDRHPEGLVWKIQSMSTGRIGEIERDNNTTPGERAQPGRPSTLRVRIPRAPESIDVHNGDVIHQRREAPGGKWKDTHPHTVGLTFAGLLREIEEEPKLNEIEEEEKKLPVDGWAQVTELAMKHAPVTALGVSLSPLWSSGSMVDLSEDREELEVMRSEINASGYSKSLQQGGKREGGAEVELGRGKCGMPAADKGLPRSHIRLFCATMIGGEPVEEHEQRWCCQVSHPHLILTSSFVLPCAY